MQFLKLSAGLMSLPNISFTPTGLLEGPGDSPPTGHTYWALESASTFLPGATGTWSHVAKPPLQARGEVYVGNLRKLSSF
jgi:hypothetical protein